MRPSAGSRSRCSTQILQDVTLPAGARVLAGGRHLYVLVAEPPEPWTIVRLDVGEVVRISAGAGRVPAS
jgi:hypothetical protein